jgi:hypothetical protein
MSHPNQCNLYGNQSPFRQLFPITFGLMALVPIGFAICWLAAVVQFQRNSQRVEGTVTKIEHVQYSSPDVGFRTFPVVRFPYGENQIEVRVKNFVEFLGEFTVGQTVTVAYPVGNPEEAIIPCFSEFFFVPLGFGGIGVLGVVAAVVMFAVEARRRQRAVLHHIPSHDARDQNEVKDQITAK